MAINISRPPSSGKNVIGFDAINDRFNEVHIREGEVVDYLDKKSLNNIDNEIKYYEFKNTSEVDFTIQLYSNDNFENINFSFSEETFVTFNKLDINDIEYYVKKYNPLDKSGGYGLQDFSSIFVKSIEGCFFNVVGLPLSLIFYHLKF